MLWACDSDLSITTTISILNDHEIPLNIFIHIPHIYIYIYVYYYININIHSPFEIIKVPLNHTYHIFPVSLCISHSPIEITFFTVKSASCMDRSTLAHPALERHALPRWTPLDAPQQRNPWHTQDLTVIGGNCVTGKW